MNKVYLNKCLHEVVQKVSAVPNNAPSQRKLSKTGFNFSTLSFTDQLKIWDYIWHNSPDFWIKIQAFLFCESHVHNKSFLIGLWEIIKNWQKNVDNWGLSDALSKIYTKILEVNPTEVLCQLKLWNKSSNCWNKRQSLVSLLYFSRTKKTILPFATIIPFVTHLLSDNEHYVQKALGWTLKELYNVYPEETLKYLTNNINMISPIAFSISIEKLDKEDKILLKSMRK